MNCKTTHERWSLADNWLKRIEESYSKDDEIIESYTEYFLVICRSIEDYLINDFLETLEPKISMSSRSEIILNKKQYRERKKNFTHNEQQKIINFLKRHDDEVKIFVKNPLVTYFRTLRNWTVHTIFPHIFENKHGEDGKILKRFFQRNFVNYLGLENGIGHLLLNNGYSLKLEDSDEDSFFDIPPLNYLKEPEKSTLKTTLETKEAKYLLKEYLTLIQQLIKKFES
jgi:hypothetical protein